MAKEGEKVLRVNLIFRTQHISLMVSALVLAVTGYALLMHKSEAGKFIINFLGGYESRALIHRISAIVLIAVCIWHYLYVLFSKKAHDEFLKIIPSISDVKDFFNTIAYYLGGKKSFPNFDKFNFIQKFQYWGVAVGMIAMIMSGLVLWFKDISMAVIPKWAIDTLIALHGYEGVVTFLVLFIWHQYNVHLNPSVFPMDSVWLDGMIDVERLRKEHPLEYDRLMSEAVKGGR
ncbi:MAG: cytochrome b/b6 domain-containing protein [Candidatus Schekmanbacteria bacterium]|nr:cytochrome b/b6 domain-containing protein [Candidatus Schekmanbacteria bacterium]